MEYPNKPISIWTIPTNRFQYGPLICGFTFSLKKNSMRLQIKKARKSDSLTRWICTQDELTPIWCDFDARNKQ